MFTEEFSTEITEEYYSIKQPKVTLHTRESSILSDPPLLTPKSNEGLNESILKYNKTVSFCFISRSPFKTFKPIKNNTIQSKSR